MEDYPYEWDEEKNRLNQANHGVSFEEARRAFEDLHRVVVKDITHSTSEERHYCIGKVEQGIVMVRFTYRGDKIKIFGAGYWRRGRELYEPVNSQATD